jgi:hypothetical protein
MTWHEHVVWRLSPLGVLHAQWPDEMGSSASVHSEDSGLLGPPVPYDATRACRRCVMVVSSVGHSATQASKGQRLSTTLTVRLARLAVGGRCFVAPDVADEFGLSLESAQKALARAARAGVLRRTPDGYVAGYRARLAAEAGL